MDVLVFEDDPSQAELLLEVVRSAGFSAECSYTGVGAFERVLALSPRLVLTDIMMPGLDGLSLCRMIAADARTAKIQRVVVSAKAYPQDREAALAAGAHAFIPKPMDLEVLRKTVAGILGAPGPKEAPGAPRGRMKVQVWGCRAPGAGLPTPCVSVAAADKLIVLDAGSGLNALSAAPFPEAKEVWLLLTHYHPDHVEGLSALPRLCAGRPLKVVGPPSPDKALERLAASLGIAGVGLYQLGESTVQLGPGLKLDSFYTFHPGTTLAFRLEHAGASLVYCPDDELESGEEPLTDFPEKLGRLACGADLLIHDARYADEEFRAGLGHSSPRLAVGLALREGVRRLMLFHAEASYGEDRLEAMRASALRQAAERFSPLVVDAARPGQELLF